MRLSRFLDLEPADPVPDWAAGAGRDEHGRWADVEIDGVRMRMRWIPPGRFVMGSPPDEAGRGEDEVQHEVDLTRGFWMGETPVTQELWERVMESNPSKFVSPRRPVETVSWEDAQEFFAKVERRVPGLDLRFPTEAEWEYACRAGTETSTYAGDAEILGANNAPLLDELAWYGGNSGVGFELEGGYDSSGWPEKQYEHERSGTREVKQKKPNDFGLYDVLGNVYEWCADWHAPYPRGPATDPVGPDRGHARVVRGGSCYELARLVRAAYRLAYDPGFRYSSLGFRCARGQAPARKGASAAEQGAGRAGEVARRRGEIELATDRGRWTFVAESRPAWARRVGRDRYGLWAEFDVRGIPHRMRWIPPGRFAMGSPADEPGRSSGEVQHEVTLTQGYWLGELPVTQELWEAVMGDNPSRFHGPLRPVEKVSWEHAVGRFLPALAEVGPRLRLPTEAEWEYACRAGTTTSTYAGDVEIVGERNAPLLDQIAWYGGNSGVGWELREGEDSSSWPQKQYDHDRAGTREVKQKKPNDFGLYDMLGNVYEWCADWQAPYTASPATDPVGPDRGRVRVIRGGSWRERARGVRAAFRGAGGPGDRGSRLGFRCARGQE